MMANSKLGRTFALALLLSIHPAAAQAFRDPSGLSRPTETPALGNQDYYWISAAILTSIPAQIRYYRMPSADTGALDRGKDLWLMDRWAAGFHSPKAGLASDLMVYPLVGLPMAATLWDAWRGDQDQGSALADAVIYAEAMTLSSSLDLLVRSLRIHPRPLVYGKDVPAKERLAGEASGSFYSGHANASFLSAVYFSYTYSLRHPGAEEQGWVWAGSLAAASLVSGLRVAAGKHFLSDILVGAAVGAGFGWAFPYLHRKPASRGGIGLGLGMGSQAETVYPMLTWTF